MKLIYNKVFLEHDTGMHPENKKRLLSLLSLNKLEETEVTSGEKYLLLFHTKDYIKRVREACKTQGRLDPDTVVSKNSYAAAVYAVGATVMASETNGFALVRPPGHHAHPERSSGFCIFNNISIAAQRLVEKGKRVLILDFDGHLGDGTEGFFYKTNKVLYWSLHQYPAFPGRGSEEELGSGEGLGYTINVPLPPGSGDDIFLEGVKRFMPVAEQFRPDIVAVSAGFDGHSHDLLLDLRLSMNAYYKLGKVLSESFRNVFATLEGGYNVAFLPKCLLNFLYGINNKSMKYKEEPTESKITIIEEFESRVDALEKRLSEHWKL